MAAIDAAHRGATRTLRAACAIGVAIAVSGCAVGPNYVRPPAEAPAAYKEAPPAQGEATPFKPAEPKDQEPRGNWWEVFKDPKLDALVFQVAVSNQTIKAAEARVREARALTQAARSALFPSVDLGVGATRSGNRNGTVNTTAITTTQGGSVRNNYNVALDVNWEIDLWGRIRRTVEASEATA